MCFEKQYQVTTINIIIFSCIVLVYHWYTAAGIGTPGTLGTAVINTNWCIQYVHSTPFNSIMSHNFLRKNVTFL